MKNKSVQNPRVQGKTYINLGFGEGEINESRRAAKMAGQTWMSVEYF